MGSENPITARKRAREWYYKNRDRALAASKPTLKKWRAANPERWALQKFKGHLKYAYGMTVEDYDAMVFEQGGLCAICKCLPTPVRGKSLRLNVDHDHKTGKVRGLLCGTCNTALHKLEASEEWADEARAYLKRSKTCPN